MRFLYTVSLALVACAMCMTGANNLGAVHEWGTFTSVAGGDGSAIRWQPLAGPSDLPCFVHRLDRRNLKAAEYGTVRMETPVLYFYPLKPLAVSVHVDVPGGRVTEWYPQASSVQPSVSRTGWIEWKNVHLANGDEHLPGAGHASHYYAARQTDGWSLTSAGENEKLLFYRGIADFGVDLRAVVHEDGVSIKNEGAETVPKAILFENRAGKIGYGIIGALREPARIQFPELNGTLGGLRHELEEQLTEMGLYRNEAHAMVETWRDSWFEEGLRVLYILPRSTVDALLPISIHPVPSQLTRVFVGRVELLSPQMRQELNAALMNSNIPALEKYGRFLNAFLQQMSSAPEGAPMSEPSRQFLERSYAHVLAESRKSGCTE